VLRAPTSGGTAGDAAQLLIPNHTCRSAMPPTTSLYAAGPDQQRKQRHHLRRRLGARHASRLVRLLGDRLRLGVHAGARDRPQPGLQPQLRRGRRDKPRLRVRLAPLQRLALYDVQDHHEHRARARWRHARAATAWGARCAAAPAAARNAGVQAAPPRAPCCAPRRPRNPRKQKQSLRAYP
jgi:hypothetical protein